MRTAPKLLPWLARRAGIGEKVALDAWREAVAAGDRRYGRGEGSSAYWSFVVAALREGIEARRRAPGAAAWRAGQRLWAVGFEASFALAQIALRTSLTLSRRPPPPSRPA